MAQPRAWASLFLRGGSSLGPANAAKGINDNFITEIQCGNYENK